MWKVPYMGTFVALVTVSCLLLCMSPAKTSAFEFASSFECRNSYNLSEELVNKTVDEYHNYTEGPRSRTILAILGKVLNSSSRFEIASAVNISTNCLDKFVADLSPFFPSVFIQLVCLLVSIS